MKGAVTPDHEMKSDDDTTPVLSSYTVWDRSLFMLDVPRLSLHYPPPSPYPPEAPRAPGPKGPDPARGAARRMEWE